MGNIGVIDCLRRGRGLAWPVMPVTRATFAVREAAIAASSSCLTRLAERSAKAELACVPCCEVSAWQQHFKTHAPGSFHLGHWWVKES
jgi:hypothetical protein